MSCDPHLYLLPKHFVIPKGNPHPPSSHSSLPLPLEQEMAAHPSVLAWKAPRTEEPRGLQSTGSPRGGHEGAHTRW